MAFMAMDCTSTRVRPAGVDLAKPEIEMLAPGLTAETSLVPIGGVIAITPFCKTNPFTSPPGP
jgi:hypothetical protein